jgi:DNA-binding MarR family transcriptional regulator
MSDEDNNSLHPLLKLMWKIEKLHEKFCMQAAKPFEITRNEADVLLFLSNNESVNTAMDIVRYRYISKSLVSKSVDSLVSQGYLESKTDTADRRYNRLFITSQAKGAVASLHEAQNEFMKILGGTLTPDEQAVLHGVIQKISNKADEHL